MSKNADEFVWAAQVLADMGYREVNLNQLCIRDRRCIEERVFERERRQIIRTRCAGLDLANLRDGFG